MMRTTKDLLRELDAEVPQHKHTVLAVAFANGTGILVWPDDPERLRHLDEAVGLGGLPLGVIAVDHVNRKRTIITYVFPEYPEEEAARILRELAVNLSEQVRH